MAVRALAEGNSIRATARIVQVDKDAVCTWLDRAAQHCRLVMLYLWRDLHVIECQLDELWSFVHTKQHHLPEFIPLSFWYDAPLIARDSDRRHDPWLVYGSPSYSPAPWSSWISRA